jgi:hypothetical protein
MIWLEGTEDSALLVPAISIPFTDYYDIGLQKG